MVARCARGPNRDGGPRERCRRRNWFAVGGDFSWLSEEDHWHDFHNVVAVQWGQPVFEAPVIFDAKRNVAAISSVGKKVDVAHGSAALEDDLCARRQWLVLRRVLLSGSDRGNPQLDESERNHPTAEWRGLHAISISRRDILRGIAAQVSWQAFCGFPSMTRWSRFMDGKPGDG